MQRSDRKQTNLERWFNLVGLPPEFPELKYISDELLEFKAWIRMKGGVDRIITDIRQQPLMQVVFTPGMGCSTIFRYVVKQIKKRSDETSIAVIDVDVEDMIQNQPSFRDGTFSHADLETMIKRGIIKTLTNNQWRNITNRPMYYKILNFSGYHNDFPAYRTEIYRLADAPRLPFEEITKKCPFFGNSLSQILQYLSDNCGIMTVLMMDIPSHCEEENFNLTIGAIKTLKENMSRYSIERTRQGVTPAAFHECYFLTQDHVQMMIRFYGGNFHKHKWDDYTAAEIISILGKQYSIPKKEYEPLLTVETMEQEIIDMAILKLEAEGAGKSLLDITRMIRQVLEESMDLEFKDLPHRAELTQDQKKELSLLRQQLGRKC
jgi:hypothetical protein